MNENFYIIIFQEGKKYNYKVIKFPKSKNQIYIELKKYIKKIQQLDFSLTDIINIIGEDNIEETSEVKIEGVTYVLHIINALVSQRIKITLTSICNHEEYIINTDVIIKGESQGNCIDNFIEKIIVPKLQQLEKYSDNILSRKTERISDTEYHNTLCYEKDFSQISNIKEIANKIAESCNKELEALTEKYTKN